MHRIDVNARGLLLYLPLQGRSGFNIHLVRRTIANTKSQVPCDEPADRVHALLPHSPDTDLSAQLDLGIFRVEPFLRDCRNRIARWSTG